MASESGSHGYISKCRPPESETEFVGCGVTE